MRTIILGLPKLNGSQGCNARLDRARIWRLTCGRPGNQILILDQCTTQQGGVRGTSGDVGFYDEGDLEWEHASQHA